MTLTMRCLLPLLLALSMCSVAPTYAIVLKNSTTGRIHDVAVKYGEFTSVGGVLDPGVEKVHAGIRERPPTVVDVVWTAEDGTTFRREVRFDLPAESNEITFEIRRDYSVQVTSRRTPM